LRSSDVEGVCASDMENKKKPVRPGIPKHGLIALLTDFGSRDHYVGTMKGVIKSISPDAEIVDITHEVSPHNSREAGYLLWASYRYFPRKTVFVCIVDPGVGSSRKIIALQTSSHTFVAPDNGLLDWVVLQENVTHSFEILQPPTPLTGRISSTFHGRDIVAPLAAYISMGKPLGQFGKEFRLKKPASCLYGDSDKSTAPQLLHIDRFGNIVTNIPERLFEKCVVGVGTTKVSKHIRNYAEAPNSIPCLIVGSNGLIEVVVKEGSAAQTLRADFSTQITVLSKS
jgi:S-adenosylmethionine hydrolase